MFTYALKQVYNSLTQKQKLDLVGKISKEESGSQELFSLCKFSRKGELYGEKKV